MKMSIKLPVLMDCDDHFDFNDVIQGLKSVIVFNPNEVAARRKQLGKNLNEFDWIELDVMREHKAFLYSPLQVGRVLMCNDKEVAFEVFSYMKERYKNKPSDFYMRSDFQRLESKKTLPQSLTWEIVKNNCSECEYESIPEEMFEEWKVLEEKQYLLSQVTMPSVSQHAVSVSEGQKNVIDFEDVFLL